MTRLLVLVLEMTGVEGAETLLGVSGSSFCLLVRGGVCCAISSFGQRKGQQKSMVLEKRVDEGAKRGSFDGGRGEGCRGLQNSKGG